METCIANLLEPGEKVVVGNNGIWGSRVVDMAGRYNSARLAARRCTIQASDCTAQILTVNSTAFSTATLLTALPCHSPSGRDQPRDGGRSRLHL